MTEQGIVFVTAYLGDPHGTAKSARDFLRALLACSDDVIVVSPKRDEMPGELCGRRLSTPVWLDGPAGGRLPRRIWRLRPPVLQNWWRTQQRKKFLEQLGGRKLAIVNGWASLGFWRQFNLDMRGTQAVIVRESPRHFSNGDYGIELAGVLAELARFDVLIFVSETCQREWMSFMELRSKRSFYVANCCEEEETESLRKKDRDAVRAKLGLNPEEFIVICPGSIERRKGQDLLFDVLPRLNESGRKTRMLLIGDPRTEWGPKMLKHIEASKWAGLVTHWPSRPGVLDAIYAADALALPSRAEAMPRTVLEAMALGTPVVACAVDGVVELIESGKTGILFGLNDKEHLLKGLLEIKGDANVKRQLTEAAYARYWKMFSRSHQFDRVREVVGEMMRG
jgi:glycosyltransferase involved in cell wall biosynthesis